jgi:hypothetical protein
MQWYTPVIPTTLEVEIRSIIAEGHPKQNVNKISSKPISQA